MFGRNDIYKSIKKQYMLVQGPPFRWCLGFAPGSCRWNPGWSEVTCVCGSLDLQLLGWGQWLMLGGASEHLIQPTSLASAVSAAGDFLEIYWSGVQWPGWRCSLFFFGWGSENTSHVHIVHFMKDPTVLGSIPKYNVCECSHGVIEWWCSR